MYVLLIAIISPAMWDSILLTALIMIAGVSLIVFMLLVAFAETKRPLNKETGLHRRSLSDSDV
jgi:heme/copper-type cytochrome/quinol oxidase subunit 2